MAVFIPRKACNSNRYCSVPQCFTKASNARHVSFHSFPKEDEVVFVENFFGKREKCNRRKVWINKLRISKPLTKSMVACSLHFALKDYFWPSMLAFNNYCIIHVYASWQVGPRLGPRCRR